MVLCSRTDGSGAGQEGKTTDGSYELAGVVQLGPENSDSLLMRGSWLAEAVPRKKNRSSFFLGSLVRRLPPVLNVCDCFPSGAAVVQSAA